MPRRPCRHRRAEERRTQRADVTRVVHSIEEVEGVLVSNAEAKRLRFESDSETLFDLPFDRLTGIDHRPSLRTWQDQHWHFFRADDAELRCTTRTVNIPTSQSSVDRVRAVRLAYERVRVCTATAHLATQAAHNQGVRAGRNAACGWLL